MDTVALRELELFIQQDAALYRQQGTAIEANLTRKVQKGTYDHSKAWKLWLYYVDNGARRYVKEYGGTSARLRDMFPKTLREHLARRFADAWLAEYRVRSNPAYRVGGSMATLSATTPPSY